MVARNYLEVYPYDKWFDRPLPQYEEGARFAPPREPLGTGPPSGARPATGLQTPPNLALARPA